MRETTPSSAHRIATIGALIALAALLALLRLRSWVPFVGAGLVYLGLLGMFWPERRRTRPPRLPEGVDRADYDRAIAALDGAAARLTAHVGQAPEADRPLFARLAELVGRIRAHHVANPGHTPATRTFVRHSLPTMIGAVDEYIDLWRRAGDDPAHRERLEEISRGLEAFVPALERIDRACVENDLAALEISVEVLREQLDRRRR